MEGQSKRTRARRHLVKSPIYGTALFTVLYIVAAWVYPGGTRANPRLEGFSFLQNYWCDLMYVKTHAGFPNPSSPIAMTAMVVLALTLMAFWYFVPYLFWEARKKVAITRVSGCLSMGTSVFVFTPFHDLFIKFTGLFGFTALATVMIALYQQRQYLLLSTGVFAFGLCVANFAIWDSARFLVALPVLQKVAFLASFGWVWITTLRVSNQLLSPSL